MQIREHGPQMENKCHFYVIGGEARGISATKSTTTGDWKESTPGKEVESYKRGDSPTFD